MKNRLILSVILIFLCAGLSPLEARQSFSLTKDIHVGKDEVQENIFSFGGDVTIEGKVTETIFALGGTITISGEVGDSVVGIGSEVIIMSSAVINKDVFSIGGKLTKEPGCVIKGDTVYFKASEGILKFLKGGLFSLQLIPLLLIFKLISLFIWFLFALLIVAIFPRQVSFAASEVRTSFWPIVGTGFLSLMIFVGLVIFSALLSLVLIGIPLLLALVVLGFAIKIFSRVVLFYFFGESLSKSFRKRSASPLLTVILGLILVNIIGFIPILGFLFSFCLSVIGWGVVIRTKFGSTENWFRRKAA